MEHDKLLEDHGMPLRPTQDVVYMLNSQPVEQKVMHWATCKGMLLPMFIQNNARSGFCQSIALAIKRQVSIVIIKRFSTFGNDWK